jgi:putative ABC transport system permease protein
VLPWSLCWQFNTVRTKEGRGLSSSAGRRPRREPTCQRRAAIPYGCLVSGGLTWPPRVLQRFVIVLASLAIAVGVLSGGGAKAVLVPAAGGMLLLFVGFAMISSHLVVPLIRVVGAPARRVGGSMGRLASANAGRNPSRTAATAAALMIGLALVTFVAVLASGLETSTKDDLTRQVTSDYVVVPDTSASATYFDAATGLG